MAGIKYSNTHIQHYNPSKQLGLEMPVNCTKTSHFHYKSRCLVAGRLLPREVLICSVDEVSQRCDSSATLHFFLQVSLRGYWFNKPIRELQGLKMQAGLYRLQSSPQRNISPSHHLLMLLFNKYYIINYIIHVRLPGFPSLTFFF